MKKKADNNSPIIEKYDIDENTNEAKIVEVPLDAVINEKTEPTFEIHEIEEPSEEVGEQLIMEKVVGYNNTNNVSKRQKVFKNVTTTLFIVIVLAVLVFTAYKDFFSGKELQSWDFVKDTLRTNWFYLIFALISLFFCYFLKGFKLAVMCKSLTGKFHFKTCFETGIIGHYYNNVTPFAVGGQPFEIYHLAKNGVDGGAAASMPIAAFFLHQVAFGVLGIVAIVLYKYNALKIPEEVMGVFPKVLSVLAIVGVFFAVFTPSLVVFLSIFPKFGTKIVRFVMNLGNKMRIVKDPVKTTEKTITNVEKNATCLRSLASRPFVFIISLLISFGEQLALCSIAYFTLRFFGFDWIAWNVWEWAQVIQLCFLLYSTITFIPTPGNSGAADLSFYLLFDIGLSVGGMAFPAMIAWRLLSFYSFIIIGFLFLARKKRKSKRKKQ